MAYGDFKDLAKRTASDKVLIDKAFSIAKSPKYDGYQRELSSMVYKFFDKNFASLSDKFVADIGVKMQVKPVQRTYANKSAFNNEKLAEDLRKPIIREFKRRTVYSGFKDNIWGADLADLQLISKFNKGFRFLLCVIDIFSKYAWVVPLKHKKGVSIANSFQKILKESNRRKANKIWVDKRSKFCNSYF